MTSPTNPESSQPPTGTTPLAATSAGAAPPAEVKKNEIVLISHSMLFYWWPIWLLGFLLAGLTYAENHRLAILPPQSTVSEDAKDDKGNSYYKLGVVQSATTRSLSSAVERSKPVPGAAATNAFPTRVSQQAWMGPLFCVVLLLTVVITNVPLRGLWTFLVLLLLLVLALLVSLIPDGWERLLGTVGHLHIYINMAGYLFIATVVFILWAVAVFVFDQRTYVVFKPGQVQVREHIGTSIRGIPGELIEVVKRQDDLFRHWLLGFFSGDLILKRTDTHEEIRLPNVLLLGWRISDVQRLLREKPTVGQQ